MNVFTKSPIKDKPLRSPGQSLEEERRKLFEDKLEMPLMLAMIFMILTAMEWWRYYWARPPSPYIFTAVVIFLVMFAAWRVWKTRPLVHALKQGVEGEKAVGQFLERLRESGYQVFHDLIGMTFPRNFVFQW